MIPRRRYFFRANPSCAWKKGGTFSRDQSAACVQACFPWACLPGKWALEDLDLPLGTMKVSQPTLGAADRTATFTFECVASCNADGVVSNGLWTVAPSGASVFSYSLNVRGVTLDRVFTGTIDSAKCTLFSACGNQCATLGFTNENDQTVTLTRA